MPTLGNIFIPAAFLLHCFPAALWPECSGHAHCSYVLVPEQKLAQPQPLCNSDFLGLSQVSLCLGFLCTVQGSVFSWHCWLIQAAVDTPVVLEWPSLVASKLAPFRQRRFLQHQVKSLIWCFIKEFLTSSVVYLVFYSNLHVFFSLSELHCLKHHREYPAVEPQCCGPVPWYIFLLFASASVKLTEYPWIVLDWFQWKAAAVFVPVLFL